MTLSEKTTNKTQASPEQTAQTVLEALRDGALSVEEAQQRLAALHAESLGFATLDHGRRDRCGAPEVVYAAGKTPDQLVQIVGRLLDREPAVLITRATPEHVDALRQAVGGSDQRPIEVGPRSGAVIVGAPAPVPKAPPIPIVTAGSSDEPVAEEAAMTCRAMGHPVHRMNDVGVAGLHRLLHRLDELRRARVIVCIAGMEGALPSVVGGLVAAPVIAVPTSVGYGVNLGGLSALLGMLTSCASGVVAVNIDNGFGAAFTACLINRPRSSDAPD